MVVVLVEVLDVALIHRVASAFRDIQTAPFLMGNNELESERNFRIWISNQAQRSVASATAQIPGTLGYTLSWNDLTSLEAMTMLLNFNNLELSFALNTLGAVGRFANVWFVSDRDDANGPHGVILELQEHLFSS